MPILLWLYIPRLNFDSIPKIGEFLARMGKTKNSLCVNLASNQIAQGNSADAKAISASQIQALESAS